ncbi:MAG TPA: phage minor head protein [Verrucomicrobiae bacterium]|nr:phage minor head protein [Verrucomicrobiae bacterium]
MAFWSRRPLEARIADAVTTALEKAAVQTAQGSAHLPAGTTTRSLAEARGAQAQTTTPLLTPLPRDPRDAVTAFGPAVPLTPAPIDPVEAWGRPLARRSQYPVAVNIQLGPQRAVPFEVLRAVADRCDVVRRCIDIRKAAIQQQDWDIALTQAATQQIMSDYAEKNPEKATAIGRKHFEAQITRVRAFLEEPDPQNHLGWSEWVGNALEEHFVWDALAIQPILTYGGDLVALRIVDGSTIKPLLDEFGNTPAPPYPAFQQVLYGFPRGEFQASSKPDREFLHDQLLYRPRDRRSGTPFGCSPTEKALPLANLYMHRQEWLLKEFSEGAIPRGLMFADAVMTPADRRQHEANLNAELGGDTSARLQWTLVPGGFKTEFPPQMAEKYKADYDEFLIKQIGAKFAVMPTQLGVISPNYGVLGRGTQPGEQDISETLGDQPLEAWLIDVVNSALRMYLGMPSALTLVFSGGGIDEDQLVRTQTQQGQVSTALRTLNDIRADNGDDLYRFPEADMPFLVTSTGPVFIPGSAQPDPAVAAAKPGGPPPATGQDAPPPQTPDDDPDGEVQKFVTFARRREGRPWRDFAFKAVTPDLGGALNRAGARGDLAAVKVLAATLPKARAATKPPSTGSGTGAPPQTVAGDALAAGAAAAIEAALAAGLTAAGIVGLAVGAAGAAHVIGRLADAGVGTAIGRHLDAVLPPLVTRAFDAGMAHAATETDTEAVAALRSPGLARTLAGLEITIRGIAQTSVDRIGVALADGMALDESPDALAARVDAVLHDPARARMIARTEVARAMETAALAQATAVHQRGKAWQTQDDARVCALCGANESEGAIHITHAFASGDQAPPAHPLCRCTVEWLAEP